MKVMHKGYPGYQYMYNDVLYRVWHCTTSKKKAWYVDVIESPYSFTERELAAPWPDKRTAIEQMQLIINQKAAKDMKELIKNYLQEQVIDKIGETRPYIDPEFIDEYANDIEELIKTQYYAKCNN